MEISSEKENIEKENLEKENKNLEKEIENLEKEISDQEIKKIDKAIQKLLLEKKLKKLKKNNNNDNDNNNNNDNNNDNDNNNNNKNKNKNQKENKITFIIPTVGRPTLERSVKSILNQTNPRWELIVIFDGLEPNYEIEHEKIRIIKLKKKIGEGVNSAGKVRNYAMQFVKTPWIGFLDDDDIISPLYVQRFLAEKKLSREKGKVLDIIIFRMYNHNNDTIFPKLNQTNFFLNQVGISFAIKTKLYKEGAQFIPSSGEDFNFLDRMRKNKNKIMISPYILYFVRPESLKIPQEISLSLGERSYIN